MNLRPAISADSAAIASVHVRAWQEAYHGILPDDFLTSLSVQRRADWWATQLADPAIAQGVLVVTDDSNQVVGFASAGPARGEGTDYLGELYAIYLLQSHQGKGFGRALFQAAAAYLDRGGLHSMMLWVLKDNPTRGFYEHLGGELFSEQALEIGSQKVLEVAYGWRDLAPFLQSNLTSK